MTTDPRERLEHLPLERQLEILQRAFDFKDQQFADVLGVQTFQFRSLRDGYIPADGNVQKRLKLLRELHGLLQIYFPDQAERQKWLRDTNLGLRWHTPREVLMEGDIQAVIFALEHRSVGAPS